MQRLLLIEVAVCAALIMVAVLVMARRWRRRRSHRSVPGRERRAAPAAPTGAGPVRQPATVVPGFADDGITPGAGLPSGPGTPSGAGARSSPVALAPAGQDRVAGRSVSDVADPEPEQAAGRHVSDVAGPEPSLNGPAGKPGEQRSATGAPASSERISSYYEEADRLMSDYLAELGWNQGRTTQDAGPHDPGASAG